MTFCFPSARRGGRIPWLLIGLATISCGTQAALAQPVISYVKPPLHGLDLSKPTNTITIVGTGFGSDPSKVILSFDPPGAVLKPATVGTISADSDGTDQDVPVTLVLSTNVQGTITITPTVSGGAGKSFDWDTGIEINQCLETIQKSGCQIRWEVDTTGVTGSSSQTNKSNSPNFLMTLDIQFAKNKDSKEANPTVRANAAKGHGASTMADRFGAHLIFKTGYTQVTTANLITPATTTSTSSGTTPASGSSTACSGMAASKASSCVAATQQNAFIADAKITGDFTMGQNGQSVYSAVGFGAHGSLQSLVQNDQIVQSGGLSYANLSSLNPRNLVGIYDGFFRYRLSQPGHDKQARPNSNAYENVSDLLVIEAGAQYDSGLSNLTGDPKNNTRRRVVGRFYAYPELPNAKHTKFKVGLEVSAGFNGGPKIVQIFWGANLNPLKLFGQ